MSWNAADSDRARRADVLLPENVVLAPMWRRVVGQLIDQLVVFVPIVIVSLALGVRSVDDVKHQAVGLNVSIVAIVFTYEWLMIGAWGRTVGKFALGTRAVRVDTAGPVLWSSSAIRALVPLAAGLIPYIGAFLSAIVYVSAFFNRRLQGWHDRAAGTIVVMNRVS